MLKAAIVLESRQQEMNKSSEESKLDHIIAGYLELLENSGCDSRDQIMAENPELEAELESFFSSHDAMRRVGYVRQSNEPSSLNSELTSATATPSKQVESELPIKELGEYTIVGELGAGGMGQVFLAIHRRMEREVAIKMLPREFADDADLVKRFHREVRVAVQLSHPNIVTAHDAGQLDDLHFLVMEYVDGCDLASLTRKTGPLSFENAARCIVQAGRALTYAHQNGIIHRDIKPSNLLLRRDGLVKVLDMGLARSTQLTPSTADSTELSSTGVIMGTVDFLAPEQATSSKNANEKSDQYSLGCTLYYLINSKPIFDGASVVEKLLAHRDAEIPRLIDEQSEAADDLNNIFQKMVARDPDLRYASIEEACQALQKAAQISDDDLKLAIELPFQRPNQSSSSTLEEVSEQNIATTRLTAPQVAPPARRQRWLMIGMLFLVAALAATPFIIRRKTPDGTLTVKCFIEGATVDVDGKEKITIKDPSDDSEYTFQLAPGEHRVTVTLADGTEIKSESVTVKSKKSTLFHASFEKSPGEVDKASGSADKASGSAKETQTDSTKKNSESAKVHTVAKDGKAAFKDLTSALAACKPNDTIRVLDAAEYKDTLFINSPEHKGITIEFIGEATWRPKQVIAGRGRLLAIEQSDITVKGVNFKLEPPSYGVIISHSSAGVRVENCNFIGGGVGVSIEGLEVADGEPPVTVIGNTFQLHVGVQLSGAETGDRRAIPTNNVLVLRNRMNDCHDQGILLRGQLKNVLCAGNVIVRAKRAGIQLQHIFPDSANIMLANNTTYQCDSAIRVWQKGAPPISIDVVNHLSYESRNISWLALESGGSTNSAQLGDGKEVGKSLRLRHNFRFGTGPATPGLVPPGKSDKVVTEVKVESHDSKDPGFMRPTKDSLLISGGAGNGLPKHVGAIPPTEEALFDWEAYFPRLVNRASSE